MFPQGPIGFEVLEPLLLRLQFARWAEVLPLAKCHRHRAGDADQASSSTGDNSRDPIAR